MFFCSLAITKIQLFIEKLLFLPYYFGVGNFSYVNEEYGEEKYNLLRNSILKLRESKRLFPVNLYGQQAIAHEADLSLQVQKEVIRALKNAGIKLTVQTDFDNYIQHIENEPDLWTMLIANN